MLRNEFIIQQQEMHKAEKIRRFRELRELALEEREKEQNARALLKQNILEMYESLQVGFQDYFPITFTVISTTSMNILINHSQDFCIQYQSLEAVNKLEISWGKG